MDRPGLSRKPLFSPAPISVHSHLVLIPRFIDSDLERKVRKESRHSRRIMGSEWLDRDPMTVISGFLGYPHLMTLLAFVDLEKIQRISVLGTAGTLGRQTSPGLVHVAGIWSSGALRVFSKKPYLDLEGEKYPGIPLVQGVSVDMIQRETPQWLWRQRMRGAGVVEMELFPLRALTRVPITALMVLSDRVTSRGIFPFSDRKAMSAVFRRGWRLLVGEDKGNSDRGGDHAG